MKKIKLSKITEKTMLPQNKELVQERLDKINAKRANVTDKQRKAAIIASTHDRDAAIAFAAAREERINAYLWAKNTALALFELVTLQHDEWVELVNLSDHNVNILETNVHGEAPVQNILQADSVARYNPYLLSSGIVKYPVLSMYTGRIDMSDVADERVARSYDQKMNTDLWTLIDAAITTFPAAALIKDSRIVSGTIPTTNALVNTSEGAFTLQIFKDIVDHFIRLGKNLSTIIVNPTEMKDIWDWQHLVSTTSSGSQDGRTMITTRIKDDILKSGELSGLLGQEFTWITDPTRALKSAWFFSDEPAGTLYDKEDLAEVVYYDAKELKLAGYGSNFNGIEMNRWVKPLIKDPQRLNFGKITFAT